MKSRNYETLRMQEIHTSLVWRVFSLKQQSSTVNGSCKGFPSNFFCSMGLRCFHSLMNANKAFLNSGLSFIQLWPFSVCFPSEKEITLSSSSSLKFSKSGLGLMSFPFTQEYKWILPVYWLTYFIKHSVG